MKDNFLQILLALINSNKGRFIGLLRRNGVLVSPKISNEDLARNILNAMDKSESFKTEVLLLMSVLSNDNAYSSFTGLPAFSSESGINYQSQYFPSSTTATTTSTTSTDTKKQFGDTTFGQVFDKLLQGFNSYTNLKMSEADKAKAIASANISNNQVALGQLPSGGQPSGQKSNTGLYIGLGIGGLALVGVLVYVIAKKK
jgi:hypothetical protein